MCSITCCIHSSPEHNRIDIVPKFSGLIVPTEFFFPKKIYLELTLQDNMEHHAHTHAHAHTHPKTDHLKVKSGWEWVGWEWVGLFKKRTSHGFQRVFNSFSLIVRISTFKLIPKIFLNVFRLK